MKKITKHIILLLLLAVLCLSEWYLPVLLQHFPALQAEQLGGSFERISRPELTVHSWLNRKFQRDFETYQKNQSDNASFFIKVRNQLNYRLLNSIAAEDVLLAKDYNLHSLDYCKAYIGYKCCDHSLLEGKADTLSQLSNWLESQNKKLLILLPPGKARVMPEQLPDFFQKRATKATNWHQIQTYLDERGIAYMDFDFLIDQHRQGVHSYPLYPQFGLHWSFYGLTVSADSIRSKLEQMLKRRLPEMKYQNQIEQRTDLMLTDEELLFAANLFYDLPKRPMPYPNIEYLQAENTTKPNMLIIGDSFYNVFLEYGIQQGLFDSDSSFWYYFRSVRPQAGDARTLDLAEEIAKRDVIILQAGELNIQSLGFGVLEKVMPLINN